MRRRTASTGAAALLVLGGLTAWFIPLTAWWGEPVVKRMSVQAPGTTLGMATAALPAAVHESAAIQPAAALEQRLFSTGSLQGAEPDGAWVLDGQGRLLPAFSVRQRFDQWLSTLGEVNPQQLTALVQAQAQRELGEAGSVQVMEVWRRYLHLQQHRWTVALDGHDLRFWASALAERQRVRRELLGVAWAEAFYRDEEAALRQHLQALAARAADGTALANQPPVVSQAAQLPALAQTPVAGTDARLLLAQRTAAFGAEAAQRLQAEDDAQADWTRRLNEARAQRAAIAADPQRSPAQREQAMAQWVEAEFSPGSERLRVRALLGL